jgi:regulator of protease activity HflC (stomatin/prohibitin superfamily)
MLLSAVFILIGCGPYKEELYIEVKPHQTAFVIDLEGSMDQQAQLKSLDALKKKQVSRKRITIDQRKKSMGRAWFNYKWIPKQDVLLVDRTPATREWTQERESGTSSRDQALYVESLDSVGFGAGATCTAEVLPESSAQFLYYFAGYIERRKDNAVLKLDQVMDQHIRPYALRLLSHAFGALSMTDCKKEKGRIFRETEAAIQKHFLAKGVTITQFGASEGLVYDDPLIQKSINEQIIAEQKIIIQRNEKEAQDEKNKKDIAFAKAGAQAKLEAAKQEYEAQLVKNETLIAKADAEAKAADLRLKAKEALMMDLEIEERLTLARAKLELGKNISNLRILPSGSGMLLGLDGASK